MYLFFVGLVIGLALGWLLGGRLDRDRLRDSESVFDDERKRWDRHRATLIEDNESLEVHVHELKGTVTRLESSLAEQRSDESAASERCASLERDRQELREQLDDFQKAYDARDRELAESRGQCDALTRQIGDRENTSERTTEEQSERIRELEQRLADQKSHDESERARLVEQSTASTADREQRQREAAQLQHELDDARAFVEERRAAQTALEQQVEQLTAAQSELDARLAERERNLATLRAQSEANDYEADLARLQTEAEERASELEVKEEQIREFRQKIMDLMRERAQLKETLEEAELEFVEDDDESEAENDDSDDEYEYEYIDDADDDADEDIEDEEEAGSAEQEADGAATSAADPVANVQQLELDQLELDELDTSVSGESVDPPLAKAEADTAAAGDRALEMNLRTLPGVGPGIERRMHAAGVHSLDDIAQLDDQGIKRLASELGSFRKRIEQNQWIENARRLLQGEPLVTDA